MFRFSSLSVFGFILPLGMAFGASVWWIAGSGFSEPESILLAYQVYPEGFAKEDFDAYPSDQPFKPEASEPMKWRSAPSVAFTYWTRFLTSFSGSPQAHAPVDPAASTELTIFLTPVFHPKDLPVSSNGVGETAPYLFPGSVSENPGLVRAETPDW